MAELPFMPWHWQAYFGDTRHLTCIEHGAYDQILGTMWLSGGTLPLDDRFIARTAKLTSTQWKRMRPTIMGFMQVVEGDQFTQPKLLEVMKAVRRHSKSQSSRARAKWLKHKGLPDAAASIRHSRGNATKIVSKSSFLLGQSSTQDEVSGLAGKKAEVVAPSEAKEENGSAEKQEAVASPETILVSPALAAKYTNRKTG